MQVLETQEGAARVDAVHQVVALHVGRQRAGVSEMALALLTQMSMPPKSRPSSPPPPATCSSKRMSHDERQRLAAGRLDLLGGRVDGAFELGMRLGRLGGDGDVGAVARGAQRDGEADAAAGAGDEQGLASERRHAVPPVLSRCHSEAGAGRLGGCDGMLPASRPARAASPAPPSRRRGRHGINGWDGSCRGVRSGRRGARGGGCRARHASQRQAPVRSLARACAGCLRAANARRGPGPASRPRLCRPRLMGALKGAVSGRNTATNRPVAHEPRGPIAAAAGILGGILGRPDAAPTRGARPARRTSPISISAEIDGSAESAGMPGRRRQSSRAGARRCAYWPARRR